MAQKRKHIRVLIAEDHTIVRKGICSLLKSEPGIEVIGESENGWDAIQKAKELKPDIVIMDIGMPDMNGLQATQQLTTQDPKIKILILTVHQDEEYILQTFQAGASGYLLKKAAPKDLILAIETVFQGDFFLSPSISRTVINEYLRLSQMRFKGSGNYQNLTNREREILQLIVENKTNKEIAEILYLSTKTVESHKANIMKKMDIQNVAELNQYIGRSRLDHTDK